jgi:flagellar hook-associated protein 3 FlgL
MIRGSDAHTDKFLQDLTAINQRIGKAEREISSGRRINAASDAPDEISHLLSLRSTLSGAEQSKANLSRVKTEVDTGEQALGHAVELLDRAQVLGAKGATGIIDADAHSTIASELDQILGQFVNLANTEIGGRFIFSGDTDQVAPYTYDHSLPNPVSPYRDASNTRQVVHPSGTRFSISKTADTIFVASNDEDNVFGSIQALSFALRNNDSTAINQALANVRTSAKYLSNQQAFYGVVQNQVTEATDFAERQIVLVKQQISSLEDADVTASILQLNDARQLQETALAAEARRPRTSLFEYLR